jgi:hypothetical protein
MGKTDEISWIQGLEGILELDLFDLSNMSELIRKALSYDAEFGRLEFLSSKRMRSSTSLADILTDPKLMVLRQSRKPDPTYRRLPKC